MSKLIVDQDPHSGITHWVDTDPSTDITSYGVDQEVAAIVEANKADYNADHGRWGEWTKVGSIPLSLYYQWMRDGTLGDQERMRKKLNDIDFRGFRTRPGTI